MRHEIEIVTRKAWDANPLVTIIGPGGAGKTTLAERLAPLLGFALVDLDRVFAERVGSIEACIREAGYEGYKRTNSELAQTLVVGLARPILLVLSSGFLANDNPQDVLAANRELVGRSYNLCLLPARGTEAIEILMVRQLNRGFDLNAENEARKARDRIPLYEVAGDLLIISREPPEQIAASVAALLR